LLWERRRRGTPFVHPAGQGHTQFGIGNAIAVAPMATGLGALNKILRRMRPLFLSFIRSGFMAAAGGHRKRIFPVARVLVGVAAVILLMPYLLTPLYLFVRPVSTLMLWRSMTRARVERVWVSLERISPELPRAVIVAEDGRFCTHKGVDLSEIREAIDEADNIASARGGSTITQQLAKNLFLWQGRSFVRKALEFPLALWINLVIPKRRQIEIYLNIVEWGPNGIFGAEAASRYAFHKPAKDLSLYEAALLAATLPNPRKRLPQQPSPLLWRLAGIYQMRSMASADIDRCVPGTPDPLGQDNRP
jgi:monofunctional glycosyltransferase